MDRAVRSHHPADARLDPAVAGPRGGAGRRARAIALPAGCWWPRPRRSWRPWPARPRSSARRACRWSCWAQGDLRRLAPYLSPRMVGAAFCPIEGKANPLAVAPAFARAARPVRHGARAGPRDRVLAIDRDGRGFMATTDRGRSPPAGSSIAPARRPAGSPPWWGSTLAIEGHPIQVNVTEPVAPLIPHLVYLAGERLTLKQARSGALLIGGGWPAKTRPRQRPMPSITPRCRANLQAALHVCRHCARCSCCAPGPRWSTGPKTGARSWASCRACPASISACFPGSASAPARSPRAVVADVILGRRARGRHRRFRRRLAAGNHAGIELSDWVARLCGRSRPDAAARVWAGLRPPSSAGCASPGGNGARNI